MIIKNYKNLAVTETRKKSLQIVEAGLAAIKTPTIIKKSIQLKGNQLKIKNKNFDIKDIDRIFLVAIGKCSFDAVPILEKLLGSRLTGGIALDVKKPPKFRKVIGLQGTHPMPSEENILATKKIINSLIKLNAKDLVIFIISGGGSTLLCLPPSGNSKEEATLLQSLFETGAPIREVNTVRKHISLARGGQLSRFAYPAKIISLIFSDVPGDDISFVASGPTLKDTTTIQDAQKVVLKYNLLAKSGLKKLNFIETPKEDKYFEKTENIILASNKDALNAMSKKAEELGYKSRICSYCLAGEAKIAGQEIIKTLSSSPQKTAFLYGGETTVTVKTKLKGGRSQELALAGLLKLKNGQTLVAFASDGKDNTDFAGAICDIITIEKTKKSKLDPKKFLDSNNSYDFFRKIGDFLLTGQTGSNVSDLVIALKE